MIRFSSLQSSLVLALPLFLPGCGGGSSGLDLTFVVQPSMGAVDTSLPIEARGNWIVYFEQESPAMPALAPGDLNGDMVADDSVAVAVSVLGNQLFPLAVAARAAHIIGDEIYLEVVEMADGRDWNGDTVMDDVVLVHWSENTLAVPNGSGICNTEGVCYVDDLDPAIVAPALPAVSHQGRVYYTAAISDMDLAAKPSGTTSLRMLETANPLMFLEVTHNDTGQRRPRIVSSDPDGILALAYDETVELAQLNTGDMDMLDTAVLALLDGTDPTRGIENVGLAISLRPSLTPVAYSPVRARLKDAGGDWLVSFLVSESDEGAVSLNDRDRAEFMGTAWEPVQCTNRDTDTTDSVLHFLHFEAWFADASLSPVRNTGLVGRVPTGVEPDRVVVVEGYVGTISSEASADCDLNQDTSSTDDVVRWTAAPTDPMVDILPPGAAAELHAVSQSPLGPSEGLASVEGRFVIVVGELEDDDDIDMDTNKDKDLVAFLDPASTTVTEWTFDHGTNFFVGASWMTDEPRQDRLAIAFQESVVATSLNSACKSLSFVDADMTDELPTFARFGGGDALFFPGVGVATSPGNPGILISGTTAYFRVSEAAQGTDFNLDGDSSDFVLMRNSLFACEPVFMGTTTNPGSGDQLVITDDFIGAAFIASETDANFDFNDNGNIGEDVLMFFAVP